MHYNRTHSAYGHTSTTNNNFKNILTSVQGQKAIHNTNCTLRQLYQGTMSTMIGRKRGEGRGGGGGGGGGGGENSTKCYTERLYL